MKNYAEQIMNFNRSKVSFRMLWDAKMKITPMKFFYLTVLNNPRRPQCTIPVYIEMARLLKHGMHIWKLHVADDWQLLNILICHWRMPAFAETLLAPTRDRTTRTLVSWLRRRWTVAWWIRMIRLDAPWYEAFRTRETKHFALSQLTSFTQIAKCTDFSGPFGKLKWKILITLIEVSVNNNKRSHIN